MRRKHRRGRFDGLVVLLVVVAAVVTMALVSRDPPQVLLIKMPAVAM